MAERPQRYNTKFNCFCASWSIDSERPMYRTTTVAFDTHLNIRDQKRDMTPPYKSPGASLVERKVARGNSAFFNRETRAKILFFPVILCFFICVVWNLNIIKRLIT